MFCDKIINDAEILLNLFRKNGYMIATAESCTGGLIAGALTEIAGSSDVVDRGFVTYTNQSKSELLAVDLKTINACGAVSAEVASAMAEGALFNSKADIAVSVTGVAGPGQSENKPAGLVYFGCAAKGHGTITDKKNFKGDRSIVRQQTILHALNLSINMASRLKSNSGE